MLKFKRKFRRQKVKGRNEWYRYVCYTGSCDAVLIVSSFANDTLRKPTDLTFCDTPRHLRHHMHLLLAAFSRAFLENGVLKIFTFRVVLFHLWRIVNLRRHEVVIYVIDATDCVTLYHKMWLATCFDQLYCHTEDARALKNIITIANFISVPEWDVTLLSKLTFTCGTRILLICCGNVSVLPEDGPLRAETCWSNTVLIKWRE